MKLSVKFVWIMLLCAAFSLAACSSQKGKGGRRQPRKGPIPCPVKDC
ncbi:hypothetical protein SAMN05421780_10992 [Flexibacter flexilis DSM 6793]|uniref:Lipoprotein n=1 Tax=Flexibacter flexilis DSM 6793 TaxID=927664 RepID=A0A1I1LR80_9BACT|nr:hypothetical protein [Flexibacter flexilis]SFC75476.1 hypothetical protein SAMN05421780_10992 [Flexibacter flexilis DSM 6793]